MKTNNELVKEGEVKRGVRSRPDKSIVNNKNSSIHAEPGEVGQYLHNAMELFALKPIDIYDPGEVGQRIQEYFEICAKQESRPSLTGLALSLGVDRGKVYKMANGMDVKSPEVNSLLKRAGVLIESFTVECMANGKLNPIPAVFILKNCHAWKDQAEVIITPNNPLGDVKSKEELLEKYESSMIIDADP